MSSGSAASATTRKCSSNAWKRFAVSFESQNKPAFLRFTPIRWRRTFSLIYEKNLDMLALIPQYVGWARVAPQLVGLLWFTKAQGFKFFRRTSPWQRRKKQRRRPRRKRSNTDRSRITAISRENSYDGCSHLNTLFSCSQKYSEFLLLTS